MWLKQIFLCKGTHCSRRRTIILRAERALTRSTSTKTEKIFLYLMFSVDYELQYYYFA